MKTVFLLLSFQLLTIIAIEQQESPAKNLNLDSNKVENVLSNSLTKLLANKIQEETLKDEKAKEISHSELTKIGQENQNRVLNQQSEKLNGVFQQIEKYPTQNGRVYQQDFVKPLNKEEIIKTMKAINSKGMLPDLNVNNKIKPVEKTKILTTNFNKFDHDDNSVSKIKHRKNIVQSVGSDNYGNFFKNSDTEHFNQNKKIINYDKYHNPILENINNSKTQSVKRIIHQDKKNPNNKQEIMEYSTVTKNVVNGGNFGDFDKMKGFGNFKSLSPMKNSLFDDFYKSSFFNGFGIGFHHDNGVLI